MKHFQRLLDVLSLTVLVMKNVTLHHLELWNCLRRSVEVSETTSPDWNSKKAQLLNYRISATKRDPIQRGSLTTNCPRSVRISEAV